MKGMRTYGRDADSRRRREEINKKREELKGNPEGLQKFEQELDAEGKQVAKILLVFIAVVLIGASLLVNLALR